MDSFTKTSNSLHRAVLLTTFFFSSLFLYSQDIKILTEQGENNQLLIHAENPAEYEQSVEVNIIQKGIKLSEKVPIVKVLPPKSKTYLLTMTPIPNKSYSYKFEYNYIQGDVTGSHDDSQIYLLPYKNGESYLIGQGYYEKPTHMKKYAIDFNMDEGTVITAARAGVVTRVVDKFNKGCPREECSQFNNFVLVKHPDGSVADYSHIKRKGALVKAGDRVKAGDPIALSGSTGWATGPHLHFEIYVMDFSGQQSIKAQYRLSKDQVGIPQKGKSYQQEY